MAYDHAASLRNTLRPALALGLVAHLAGCLTDRTERSTIWPPADFVLQMQRLETVKGVTHVRQHLQIDTAGLLVYRQSDKSLVRPDGRYVLPLFRSMCVYQLEPVSVRMLARELHRAQVLQVEQGDPNALSGDGVVIQLQWNAFARDHEITAGSDGLVGFSRLLSIVNSYLPDGAAFQFPDSRAPALDKRLELMPAVAEDLAGAYGAHLDLLGRLGPSQQLVLHTFALAVALGRTRDATELLSDMDTATYEAPGVGPEGYGPGSAEDLQLELQPYLDALTGN